MAVKAILPTTNLEYSDVRDTLNANGGSVNNNMSSLFKEAANINMWSKNKPESYNKTFDLTQEDRIKNSFGLSFELVDGFYKWVYTLPTGGESSPYRLGDFRGYQKDQISGMALKSKTFSKDIFKDKTPLIINVEDDINKITPYDMKDTVLKDKQLMLMVISKTSPSNTSKIIDINKRELSFQLTHDDLTQLGSGVFSLDMQGYKNGVTSNICPNELGRGELTITANTGIKCVTFPDQVSVKTEASGQSIPISEYYAPQGSKILNLDYKNLYFVNMGLVSSDGIIMSQNNIFVDFWWDEKNAKVRLYEGENIGNWSGVNSDPELTCRNEDMPAFTTDIQPSAYVDIKLVYLHTDGRYYDITPSVKIRIKRDYGSN